MSSNIDEAVGYRQHAIESSIIVCVGMLIHMSRISIIDLNYSKLPLLIPNAASSLFIFSILCIFSKLRPLWPKTLRKPTTLLAFIIELGVILYATDFVIRQLWLPSLKLLNFVCHFMGQYIVVTNQKFVNYNAPHLANWIRNDGFFLARFLLAIVAFNFMLDVTGAKKLIQNQLNSLAADIQNHIGMVKPATTVSIDAYELSSDRLNVGRRRQQPPRKAKRKVNILKLNDQNDNYC